MRYEHGFGLQVPYLDHTTDPPSAQKALISTNESIDRRRVKRGLRRWISQELGHKVHTATLRLYLKNIMVHKQPMFYVRQSNAKTISEGSSASQASDTKQAAE